MPNNRLVVLALTLPVATATVERAFSIMKFVKNELRNKMGGEWLNHRMVCYIERDVFPNIKDDDILYHFQELKSRLKKLPPLSQTRESDMLLSYITIIFVKRSIIFMACIANVLKHQIHV
jgi:hypothetical protein